MKGLEHLRITERRIIRIIVIEDQVERIKIMGNGVQVGTRSYRA